MSWGMTTKIVQRINHEHVTGTVRVRVACVGNNASVREEVGDVERVDVVPPRPVSKSGPLPKRCLT